MQGTFGIREFSYVDGMLHVKGDLLDKNDNPINDVRRPIYLTPIQILGRVEAQVQIAVEAAIEEAEGRRLDDIEIEAIRSPIVAQDNLYVALKRFLAALDDEIQATGVGGEQIAGE